MSWGGQESSRRLGVPRQNYQYPGRERRAYFTPQIRGFGKDGYSNGKMGTSLHLDAGSFPEASPAPPRPPRPQAGKGQPPRGHWGTLLRLRPHGTSQAPPRTQSGQTPSSRPRSPSPRPLKLTPAGPATGGGPTEPQPPGPRGHGLPRGRRNRRAQVLLRPPSRKPSPRAGFRGTGPFRTLRSGCAPPPGGALAPRWGLVAAGAASPSSHIFRGRGGWTGGHLVGSAGKQASLLEGQSATHASRSANSSPGGCAKPVLHAKSILGRKIGKDGFCSLLFSGWARLTVPTTWSRSWLNSRFCKDGFLGLLEWVCAQVPHLIGHINMDLETRPVDLGGNFVIRRALYKLSRFVYIV